jgi:subtilase family serine protease
MLKRKRLFGLVLGGGILLVCGIGPVFGADWKVLPGHVPSVLPNLTAKGLLPATNQLRLSIGLPLRDGPGLEKFLAQLYDPASPDFHRYLTLEELTSKFVPTEQDYEAAKAFARTNGLTVTATYRNRLVLDVVGPASAVEQAFHVTLRTYRHPSEARDFFAPDSDPRVDAALPIVDIQGLSDFSRPHPMLHRVNAAAGSRAPKGGSSPDNLGGYFGNDFRNAYVPTTALTGAGQIVGVLEFDGFYPSDITTYAMAAGGGRSNIPIEPVLVDGVSGTPGYSGIAGADGEVSLDIEMAISMAPGLAAVEVFEGSTQNDILNAMLTASNTVNTLSSSWAWSGGPSNTTDNIFISMAAVGQSFFNAAGDSDAFTTGATSANGVDNTSLDTAPASSPYITQVGGTTLTTGSNAVYSSETAWNWGYDSSAGRYVGTSGGISSYYSIPSWQTSVSNMAARGGSASFRNIPDVALIADNVYVDYNNGSSDEFGGTSCAAPLWAAFMALVNPQSAAGGGPTAGFINPAVYAIATGPEYAACFRDVTTGNNTSSSSPNLFYATNGYDLCTGLGTPAGQNLINALVAAAAFNVSPLSGAASGVAGGPFTVTSGNFLLTDVTSAPLTWSVSGIPVWLKLSATNGTLTPGAQINLAASLAAAAGNLTVGTYAANLIFSNLTAQGAQAGLFTLQVSQPFTVSPTNGFNASGPVGGPFNVTSQNISLSNQSGASFSWSITNLPAWLGASPASGTLAGGAQTSVTIGLTAAANSLGLGTFTDNVLVTNPAGLAASIPFTIKVGLSLVNNGGFETGSFSGWTLSGSTKYNLITASNDLVHSGTYGAALGQYPSLGSLSQTLATSPGQNYLLSLWLDNPSNPYGVTPNQFVVLWNGKTLFNQSNIPLIAWTNLQFIVTATAASTVLQLEFEDSPYFLGVDDVSVISISPPVFQSVQLVPAKGANFNLTWSAIAGLAYQVQFSTNLLQTNWINLGSPFTAITNSLTISDTNALLNSSRRFYRLLVVP